MVFYIIDCQVTSAEIIGFFAIQNHKHWELSKFDDSVAYFFFELSAVDTANVDFGDWVFNVVLLFPIALILKPIIVYLTVCQVQLLAFLAPTQRMEQVHKPSVILKYLIRMIRHDKLVKIYWIDPATSRTFFCIWAWKEIMFLLSWDV